MRSAAAIAMPATVRVRRCGALAYAALRASGGITRTLPGFEATSFHLAGDQVVWISESGPDHPRTVLIDAGTPWSVLEMREDTQISVCEFVETLGGCDFPIDEYRTSASRAILSLIDISSPRGFATLLKGQSPPFPLSHRVDAVHALAQACAADDDAAFVHHAHGLLGVGGGLTPSGDDFVGGALFAMHWLHRRDTVRSEVNGAPDRALPAAGWRPQIPQIPRLPSRPRLSWHAAAAQVVAHAASRTHVISAALLSDLARGQSYAALHDFAACIAHGDDEAALTHAVAVTSIGASSGWDMLAGFMAALRGSAGPLMLAPSAGLLHHVTPPIFPHP